MLMTDTAIIDGILDREQQGTPPYLAPGDAGGRTSWGISERAHPEAWRYGVPTRADARAIYATQYVRPFDRLTTAGADDRLRVAVIDDAVMSGVDAATKRLQVVLGVVPDGIEGWIVRILSFLP
jgi:lysozyme family protein